MSAKDDLDALMRGARAGDKEVYRRFLQACAARLKGFYAQRISDAAQAEDLVQETLIALHEKRDSHDPIRPVAPWLFAIARYKMIDHFRRTGRRAETQGVEADAAVAPDELAGRDVARLLDQLPESQSEAIRLTRIEGLTMQEASERTGVGVSALKVRVHRGLARLREVAESEPE